MMFLKKMTGVHGNIDYRNSKTLLSNYVLQNFSRFLHRALKFQRVLI
jgi:hypothetical protein